MPWMTETYVLTTMLLILQGLQFTTLKAQVNPDLRGQVRMEVLSSAFKLNIWNRTYYIQAGTIFYTPYKDRNTITALKDRVLALPYADFQEKISMDILCGNCQTFYIRKFDISTRNIHADFFLQNWYLLCQRDSKKYITPPMPLLELYPSR